MSRDWTPEEIQAVSQEMKKAGHMGYEECCEALDSGGFTITGKREEDSEEEQIK